jgi:hypothetical protein
MVAGPRAIVGSSVRTTTLTWRVVTSGTRPYMSAMPLPTFTHVDVRSIETFADAIQNKAAYSAVSATLRIRGIDVPIRAVTAHGANPGAMLRPDEMRALYSPIQRDIQVGCGGVRIPRQPTAFEHVVCVVGHEALHAVQHPHFPQEKIDEAATLGKMADHSADEYEAYITCDVELPAHAVMIALALRASRPDDFDVAARNTPIYRYFERRLADAQRKDEALRRLIDAARVMHPQLIPVETGA